MLNGSGSIDIAGGKHYFLAFLGLEEVRQFGGMSCFTGTLETRHENDSRLSFEVKVGGFSSHEICAHASEIAAAAGCGARIVGVNCRDLRNFSTDVSLLERLLAKAPARCVRVAESGMHSAEAVARAKDAGADGFLVGTALMRAQRPGEKLAELIKGAKRK